MNEKQTTNQVEAQLLTIEQAAELFKICAFQIRRFERMATGALYRSTIHGTNAGSSRAILFEPSKGLKEKRNDFKK